jgi:pyruvate,water dikinase
MTTIETKPLVLALDELDATMLATVGGKAANLGELTGAKLPVPGGFCVTTEAYARVAPEFDLDGPELASRARELLLKAEVPADVEAAIRAAYEELGDKTPVAVRSSATAEDLPYASFAGQQDTYLHIIGADAVVDAVRRCWASLWTDRAVAYRTSNGIDHALVQLAVVVQQMVDAEIAGVLLTANPLTGRRREAVIDASLGLGESVVSGSVNPDRFVVDTRSGTISERRLGDKRTLIRSLPGGGTETIELPDGSDAACLTDDQILELTALGDQVEKHYGWPQDIEWAIEPGGKLWLTQARPITTLYPLPADAPEDELRAYFNVNVAQGMLRPFTPMGIGAFRLVGSGVAALLKRPVADPVQGPPILKEAGGRLFVDATLALRSRMGRDVIPRVLDVMEARSSAMMRTLFDEPRFSVIYPSRRPVIAAVGRLAWKFRAPQQIRRALTNPAAARKYVADLEAMLSDGIGTPSDAAGHLRVAEQILFERVSRLIPSVLPTMLAGVVVYVVAGKLLPGADPELRQAVLRSMPHNVTTEMDLQLWALASAIRADDEAAAELLDTPATELVTRYQDGTLVRTTQNGLKTFLGRYGHRAVGEIDLGMPRWSDDPTHILGVLANYLRMDDPQLAPDAQFARGAAEAEEAIEKLVAQARQRGRLRARMVRFGLRRSRDLIGIRESPKFLLVVALGMARQHIAAAGRSLVDRGLLVQADDVLFLDLGEAREAVAGRDFRPLVAQRREAYEQEIRRRTLPRILLSDGTEPDAGARRTDLPPGALDGTPASSGTVTGVARVVMDPTGAHLEPGEILVAPSTDPGWTPLFLTAGGLVMEMGGANSHGAMVAREYGIPAVVGVADATHRISTGDTITVDGAAGVVIPG